MKKIAIIVDIEGWAFYNNAEQIKKYLGKFFEIDVISMNIFDDNIVKMLVYTYKYDLTFFMWRGNLAWLMEANSREYIGKLGYDWNEFIEKFVKYKNIVTGIFDHLFLEKNNKITEFVLENVKNYIVTTKILNNIYSNYEKKPQMIVSDGVDLELFNTSNIDRYSNINRKIFIGWTGNSKFKDENDDDLKGLQKIIKPAIKELQDEGYDIELKIADRNIKMIPHTEMPSYYKDIDLYVCASRTEGGPAPVLEAMACGIPIISTNVGIVEEAFGDEQKKFIITRDKDDLKNKIKILLDNREYFKILSMENSKEVKIWSWKNKAMLYKDFFEKNL